jgi:hypothetical protein
MSTGWPLAAYASLQGKGLHTYFRQLGNLGGDDRAPG